MTVSLRKVYSVCYFAFNLAVTLLFYMSLCWHDGKGFQWMTSMARIFWAVLVSVIQLTARTKTWCQNEPPAVRTECYAVHAVIGVYLRTCCLNLTVWESYCLRNLSPLMTHPVTTCWPTLDHQGSSIFLWSQRTLQIHHNTSWNLITVTIRTTLTQPDFLVLGH